VIEENGREILGSPLLAADAKYGFDLMYLNDANSDVTQALTQRLGVPLPKGVVVRNLDCNDAAHDARQTLFSGSQASSTLGLAVIDPTAFQLRLDALHAMTVGLKIDLLITFMTSYLRRFIDHPSYAQTLDAFFGAPDWRRLVDLRRAGEKVTFRKLLDLYEDKLRELGYTEVDDHIPVVNAKGQPIYHLVFASKDKTGKEFFEKISRRRFSGQWDLF
jgi:three-Cys-motif partner protein